VTGVCGFPVINLTHPTADGWSGTPDANVESVRGAECWLILTSGTRREVTSPIGPGKFTR
jgi:hypothetical protein